MSDVNAEVARRRFARLSEMPLTSVGATAGMAPREMWNSIRDVFRQREMLDLLVRRDLKAKYKDSALGFVWSLARPLMQLAIYYVVLGHFLGAARGIPDFAVFVFSGLTAIGLFQEIAVGGTGSILANAGLVKKVYLPREVFPLASAGSALFNAGVQLLVLIVATFIAGSPPLHPQILYVVPATLVLVVYGLAFGLLFGAVNVYLRDTQYLVEVAMMLVFWASPVVYSWQMVHELVTNTFVMDLYTANPLTLAVIGYQKAFWVAGDVLAQPADLLLKLTIALVFGLMLLLASHRVFLRLQGNFAQEL